LLLLFTVIGLGYLFGNIHVFGFKLGVAAVLFVGIAFSAIDPRLSLPEYIYIIGLVLFVYAIGLSAGPGFFASFQKRGIRISLIAILILSSGAVVAGLIGKIMGLSAASTAGLNCGALTNTPALAAAVEAVKNLSAALPPERLEFLLNSPVVTYGLAYPFGVFGVILWMFLFAKIYRIDFQRENAERQLDAESEGIVSQAFKITNPAVFNKTIAEAMAMLENPGFVLSRIKKGDRIEIATGETALERNDLVVAVGPPHALKTAHILFGEKTSEKLAERRDETSYRRIFVSNRAVVGKMVGDIMRQKNFIATITRLQRGNVEFVPSANTILAMGDRIMGGTPRQQGERVTEFFGDSFIALSETDYLSLSLGIVLGVFLGMIPLPLPNGTTFKLGFAGGPLVAGLILGKLERTGPIQWSMPYNANMVIRQIGLVFFLAAIGTRAGFGFTETFKTGGWGLIVAAAAITSFVSVASLLIAFKYLKIPMSAAMGLTSGIHTQPACLAYANQQGENDLPTLWYATVQPASMIAKILLAQIIVTTLLLH